MRGPGIQYQIDFLQDEISEISQRISGLKQWDWRDYQDFNNHLWHTLGDVKVGDDKFYPQDILKALKPDKYQELFRKYWDNQLIELNTELNELKAKYPES